MKKTWLIYVDVIKFNIFGYIKEQIERSNEAEILWGIGEKHLQMISKGQEVYFYLTNAKNKDKIGNVEYHFLKRFAFQGIITEITEQKPTDSEFWHLDRDADNDLLFKKYARIKITKDITDKNIKSNVIKWNIGKNSERRMFLLEDENITKLNKAMEEEL